MRLRGYTESIEVLIDILDEMREIKELMKQKQAEKNEQPIVQVEKVTQRGSRNVNKF